MRFGSLFTGGGGFDIGARDAGLELVWGVEYIPAIADWANSQLGEHVRCMDILVADPADFEPVDWLHASPPCPSFSVANAKGGETAQDIALSAAVARFLAHHRPRYFSLENVYAYRNSQSWRAIRDELDRIGYGYAVEHVNSADFGVPQKRRRMIVRAERGTLFHPAPMRPTHAEGGAGGLLPWVGWWEAVEDLVDTFPASKLAPWQVRRLEAVGDLPAPGAVLVEGVSKGDRPPTLEDEGEPAFTIETGAGGRLHRAILVDPSNSHPNRGPIDAGADDPAWTLRGSQGAEKYRAILGNGSNSDLTPEVDPSDTITAHWNQNQIRLLEGARVVALTPRALARFQTFPDWYELPEKKTLAVTIIGNAVPCLLAQRIVESMTGGNT